MLIGRKPIGTVAYLGGVPAVLEEFCWSWSQMVQYNQEFLCSDKEYIHYDRAKISYHSTARNSLAERFLGDWLVQLDTDHSFDPDIICRLLDRANKYEIDVLCGLYVTRAYPHLPVLYGWREGVGPDRIVDWKDDGASIMRCHGAGAGCLFVRRSVFEKMDGPFSIRKGLSEDLSFFDRCRELDIPVYTDPRIEIAHLGTKGYTTEDRQIHGNLKFCETEGCS